MGRTKRGVHKITYMYFKEFNMKYIKKKVYLLIIMYNVFNVFIVFHFSVSKGGGDL